MDVGYRKKITHIAREHDDGGFVVKNQVVDIVEKYHEAAVNQEFHSIHPAVVERVYLNPDDPDFPQTENDDGDLVKDYSAIGCIKVTLLHSKPVQTLDGVIKPLSPHLVQYPLKGEVVNIASYHNQLFYHHPLNLNNSISYNNAGVSPDVVIADLLAYNRKIKAQPGDTVIQGRYGQSIHFGSDVNNVKPNIKISVGQGFNEALNLKKNSDINYPHEEDINNEEAAIWISSAEHNPIKTGAPSKDKSARTTGNGESDLHSNIVLNADSLIFNSKQTKISIFAKTNFNVSAHKEINLETPNGKINLLYPDANNPMVKGRELTKFLKSIISTFKKDSDRLRAVMMPMVGEKIQKKLRDDRKTLRGEVDDLKSKLKLNISQNKFPSFCSKRVMIGEDAKAGFEDDLPSLESMWNSVVWNEIEETADQGYEVEKITSTAGERG